MSLRYRVVPHVSIYQFKWALEKQAGVGWHKIKYYVYKGQALEDLERLSTAPIYYTPKGT